MYFQLNAQNAQNYWHFFCLPFIRKKKTFQDVVYQQKKTKLMYN